MPVCTYRNPGRAGVHSRQRRQRVQSPQQHHAVRADRRGERARGGTRRVCLARDQRQGLSAVAEQAPVQQAVQAQRARRQRAPWGGGMRI